MDGFSFSFIHGMDGFVIFTDLIGWMAFSIFIHPFIGWMGFIFSFIHRMDGFFIFHSFMGWMVFSFFIRSWDGCFFHFSFVHGMDVFSFSIQAFTD